MTNKPLKNIGRQPTDTITKEHLEEFIITQDDFALELYAYSLARELGYAARHAGSYNDPVTGKARQFDVQATTYCGDNLYVNLAIECKALRPSHPLLISQIPRIREESYQDFVCSPGATKHGTRIKPTVQKLISVASLYPPNEYVGKSLAQVGFNGEGKLMSKDSEVYEKWGQAIASCSELIRQAAKLNEDVSSPWKNSAILPVLVVPDGTLWVANYAEGGARQEGPMLTDRAVYYIDSKQVIKDTAIPVFTISHLHIVTKTGLVTLLGNLKKGGESAEHLLNMIYCQNDWV